MDASETAAPLCRRASRVIVGPMSVSRHPGNAALRAIYLTASVASLVACGDRTGLLLPFETQGQSADAGAASVTLDASEQQDTLPPLDVSEPHDVASECPDAGSTLVYVITVSGNLMSFFPPTATFRPIGPIGCPAGRLDGGELATPFSMAVDRSGIAYVVYNNGELFRVSTATASCRTTSFVSGQNAFSATFGMGFSANTTGTSEVLYVASDEEEPDSGPLIPSRLATIDTTTFTLRVVGALPGFANKAELTGTGAGDLFAFYQPPADSDSFIGQIDKSTARITGQSRLPNIDQGNGWAFAFWGGDFYTFTAPGQLDPNPTVVSRFRPSDGSIVQLTTLGDEIVGAGVSTCAPQQ